MKDQFFSISLYFIEKEMYFSALHVTSIFCFQDPLFLFISRKNSQYFACTEIEILKVAEWIMVENSSMFEF
jgi:hypothetical protein